MLKFLYLAMQGPLSKDPLRTLLQADFKPQALILPAEDSQQRPRPVLAPTNTALPFDILSLQPSPKTESIAQLAQRFDVPIWEIGRPHRKETHHWFKQFEVEVVVVACFPYRIPKSWLVKPKWGWLNLHPSLLPAYRGPSPLYWQIHRQERQGGVTLHYMNAGLDRGDIIEQKAFPIDPNTSERQLEAYCAQLSADLLLNALQTLQSDKALVQQPQAEDKASYFGLPPQA